MEAGTYYFTCSKSGISNPFVYDGSNNGFTEVGSVVLVTGTEYIYSITVAELTGVTAFDCSDFSGTPYTVRFWDGDPTIVGSSAIAIQPELIDATLLDFSNLPTSDPSMNGKLWLNSNVVTMSTGV